MANVPTTIEPFLAADKKLAEKYRGASREWVTQLVDAQTFEMFSQFLGSKDPWNADPEDVAAWCAHRADAGRCVSTIKGDLCHLNYVFERLGKGHIVGKTGQGVRVPSPCRNPIVWETMKGIKILHPAKIETKRPISLECLEALIDIQPETLSGIRNRAFFALTWAGAMRTSEVISLDVAPKQGGKGFLAIKNDGLVLVLSQSKARQSPIVPEYYGIPKRRSAPKHCPVALVQNWLRVAKIRQGPLFPAVHYGSTMNKRTDPKRVAWLLRDSLTAIGEPVTEYGVRSFRSGCIEWLLKEGVHPHRVKDHTGHTRLSTMLGYLRGAASMEASPFMKTSWVK